MLMPPATITPPMKLPVAPVAPGATVHNTLAMLGIALNIHSDYNRDGTTDVDAPDYPVRLVRPGAILLANLDISDMSVLPSPRPADLAPWRDCLDVIINGGADPDQMTTVLLEEPQNPVKSNATRVLLRMATKDASRIRAFAVQAVGPATVILGKGVAAGQSETEVPVMDLNLKLFPTLRVEAITLPGDPALPGPGGSAPGRPVPFAAKLPAGSSGSPVYAKRAPGEIWMELVHQDSSQTDLASPRDVALFTIAPFLLLNNLQPVRRIFVMYIGNLNHAFVYDLAEACQGIFGSSISVPADSSTALTPSSVSSPGPLYIVDGGKYGDDVWLQDEMEIGYSWAPHAWMHVVLHCKRGGKLGDFVHAELLAPGVGLFDGVHGNMTDSTDFGGNLEVSPPVATATPALPIDASGPAVRAHKPAPFGKILLGDSHDRPAATDFREFLFAQKVQPVLPIDTSWLDVGHVDEFLSFIPAPTDKGYKMPFASILAMNILLEEVKKVPVANGRTNFHRGKWDAAGIYLEISIEDLIRDHRAANNRVRAEKTIPIDRRLKAGLNLTESDIVRVPVYFGAPPAVSPDIDDTNRVVAFTAGMVNMLVVGNDLMIPKPFGVRLRPDDATAVLKRIFTRLGINVSPKLAGTTDQYWVIAGDPVERVACYFTEPGNVADRQNIIDHINAPGQALSASNAALVATRAAEIAAANPSLASQIVPLTATGTFPNPVRLQIPNDTVDLVESYMLSVLEPLGVTCHFLDNWFYHVREGEIHCGTNVIREPPELTDDRRWWDTYDPEYDTRYAV